MAEFDAKRDPARCPSHPGAVLSDMVPATGMTKASIAASLGISRQQLHDILSETKPLSPRIAARIGKAFGGSTASWLNLQSAYDAWHAERDMADEIRRIPALVPAGLRSSPTAAPASGRLFERDRMAARKPRPGARRAS
jgi:addiction module HigA family antidote